MEIGELEKKAIKFWPNVLSGKEQSASIIPKLIESQDKFISLLNISDASPFAWIDTLNNTKSLPANLFLKHLAVLSDIGGEKLMRFKKELPAILKKEEVDFVWNNNTYKYKFQTINKKRNWSNTTLNIDGKGLMNEFGLSPMIVDVATLLLFGSGIICDDIPEEILSKCIIGNLLGEGENLEDFVKKRYIWVSRITGGATANAMGQLCQNYVKDFLTTHLAHWRINKDKFSDVSHNERTNLAVDIVAKSPSGRMCAIEVSFQVTTNSTIERKAGQAQNRQELLHAQGHKIAYVIDGAGNFMRRSAISTICRYSDCTVTFCHQELLKLVEFLKEIE